MPDDNKTPTAIRLNILGDLEVERDGERLPLPETAAAHHLIALFAVKERYADQELVNILWPGDSLSDTYGGKAVRARLDRAVSDARAALGVRASSGVLKRRNGIVHRARGNQVTITTDLDEFHRLRQSDHADDRRVALALVRGRIAQHVPTRNMGTDWIAGQERFQLEHVETLLKQLDSDAADETIKHRALEVLDGRWLPRAAETREPSEPDTATPTAAASDVTVPSLPPSGLDGSINPKRKRLAKRYVAVGFVATLLALAGVLLPVPSGGVSIPPEGSVIDADTGAIVAHPRVIASPMPAQLGGGPIFRACDLSAKSPCGRGHFGRTPLKVRVGDIIAFGVTLNDGTSTPIHYVKLVGSSSSVSIIIRNRQTEQKKPGDPSCRCTLAPSLTELEIRMSVKWPEVLGEHEVVNEPGFIDNHSDGERPPIKSIYLQLPRSGHYGMVYISGSTTLVNEETHFFHYLPDGIMSSGIDLENVGSPPSCFWCAEQYIRSVDFHMRVTSASE
jgi:hypothetical protein